MLTPDNNCAYSDKMTTEKHEKGQLTENLSEKTAPVLFSKASYQSKTSRCVRNLLKMLPRVESVA